MKKYLQKEYENLLTLEVVCHGVPSPKVWKDYLKFSKNNFKEKVKELSSEGNLDISNVTFRDKANGWKNYNVKISYSLDNVDNSSLSCNFNELTPFKDNLYMRGFLKDIFLRPSCFQCPAKQGKSGADIAIADYWGIQRIHPDLDDDKGVNLVLINTQKGETYLNEIEAALTYIKSDYRKAIANNPCIVKSVAEPSQRVLFWKEYESHGVACIDGICQSMTPSKFSVLFGRIVRKLKSFVR